MRNLLLITSLSALIFGCSSTSQSKKEFIFGCTAGFDSPALKKGCECAYDNLAKKYGGEEILVAKLNDMNQIESVMQEVAISAQQCNQY